MAHLLGTFFIIIKYVSATCEYPELWIVANPTQIPPTVLMIHISSFANTLHLHFSSVFFLTSN